MEKVRCTFLGPFISVPLIAKRELDVYEYALYSEYIARAQWTNEGIDLGCRLGTEVAKMGKNKFIAARQSLADKGYIDIEEPTRVSDSPVVTLRFEVWERNAQEFGASVSDVNKALALLKNQELTPEQQEVILELASLISDASVPNEGHGVSNEGRQRPQSGTDSYIDESVNVNHQSVEPESELEPTPASGSSSSRKRDPYAQLVDNKPTWDDADEKGVSKTYALAAQSDLAKWIIGKTGKPLTSDDIAHIGSSIRITNAATGVTENHPSPMQYWDQENFRIFVDERYGQWVMLNPGKLKQTKFLAHIRKLRNPKFEDNPQAWPGYLQWLEQRAITKQSTDTSFSHITPDEPGDPNELTDAEIMMGYYNGEDGRVYSPDGELDLTRYLYEQQDAVPA